MNQFMVVFELPLVLPEDFIALIPEQRQRIDELISGGTMQSYAVSEDRLQIWSTIFASSKKEVQTIIDTLPLTVYMSVQIHSLLFNNTRSIVIPKPSLN